MRNWKEVFEVEQENVLEGNTNMEAEVANEGVQQEDERIAYCGNKNKTKKDNI